MAYPPARETTEKARPAPIIKAEAIDARHRGATSSWLNTRMGPTVTENKAVDMTKPKPAAAHWGTRARGSRNSATPIVPQYTIRGLPHRTTSKGAASAAGTDNNCATADRMPIKAVGTPRPSSI